MTTAAAPSGETAAPTGGGASFFPDTPPARPAPAAPPSPPGEGAATGAAPNPASAAAPATPEPPPYENPWLEKYAKGKYRTFAEVEKAQSEGVSALHKAEARLRAMEAKNPLLKGPPIDPETGLPGAYTFEPSKENQERGRAVDPEDPVLQVVTGWGHKWSIPQEAMQELFAQAYEPMYDADTDAYMESENRALIDYFGSAEAMEAGRNQIAWKLMDIMGGEEAYPEIKQAINSSRTMKFFDKMLKAMDNVSLPMGGGGAAPQQGDTEAQILEMMRTDPEWQSKPEKVARRRAWIQAEAARQEAGGGGRAPDSPLHEIHREAQGRR